MHCSVFSRVCLCAALLLCSSLAARGQSSTLILPASEPLWTSLRPTIQNLLPSYDLFMASLTSQLELSQGTAKSLRDDNESLTASNAISESLNAGLETSLQLSRGQVATSESKSKQLAKDLKDSTDSITRAKADAKALELRDSILRAVAYVAVPILAVETAYILLHLAGVLK